MKIEGNLLKMKADYASPVQYFLRVGNDEMPLNERINSTIRIEFSGVIHCSKCGSKTSKSYSRGFCYSCMQTAPEADPCIIHPEKSMAQFGISRDMEWAQKHDLIPHYVYLSLTSGLKVGVTRYHQIPVRWIDQGAVSAIKLAETPNRHVAGVIENYLKQFVADKTHWQQMLKAGHNSTIDLVEEKKRIANLLHPEFKQYLLSDNTVLRISYPGKINFELLKALALDKQKTVQGKLMAIKGQYLVFDNGTCINLQKHTGYYVNVFND